MTAERGAGDAPVRAAATHRPVLTTQVLRARLSDLATVIALLRPVNFTAFATVSISPSGIEVVTESQRVVQAHAYLYSSIFDTYDFVPPDAYSDDAQSDEEDAEAPPFVCFEINLSTMLSCLSLLETAQQRGSAGKRALARDAEPRGPREADEEEEANPFQDRPFAEPPRLARAAALPTVEFVYGGPGHPLALNLHDGRLQTRFQLRTLDAGAVQSLQFDGRELAAHVIMRSEWLADAFQEIQSSGESRVRVQFEPKQRSAPAAMRLSTEGNYGTAEIEFPEDDQLTEKFECRAPADNYYPLLCFTHMLPALRASVKTSLRNDLNAMLSLQFMIATRRSGLQHERSVAGSGHAFVEFLCCPLEAMDEYP